MHSADACASLDCGLDFIWVSNHGGRQLDSGRATIDALPRIASAIGNQAPIIVDGGFRRGTDIIKGLALGATIVAIGRPYMWGLAHAGADGAEAISKLLEAELRVDMALARPDIRARHRCATWWTTSTTSSPLSSTSAACRFTSSHAGNITSVMIGIRSVSGTTTTAMNRLSHP